MQLPCLFVLSFFFFKKKMSYHYKSYSQTTTSTTRRSGGQSHTTSTTHTTTSSSDTGTQSSVIIREVSENELSGLSIETTQNYEITDNDKLTQYDFLSLMDSEDEAETTETESESDVEYHWFPSLLRHSVIQFLDDKEQENYMLDDVEDTQAQIEENEDEDEQEQEQEDEEEDMEEDESGKRQYRRRSWANKKHKRPKKSEQVPVEVVRIYL
jgi:hypothetical protein